MFESKEFAEGIAYCLQTLRDFEAKHGHLQIDGLVAHGLSVRLRHMEVICHDNEFMVVDREPSIIQTPKS